MADARKRVEIVIDFLTGQSAGSFSKLKTDLGTTEGAFGKAKVASGAMKDAVIANAGNIALIAGGALATFGAKSVSAFQDTALEVGKFSDATGLSLDAASRLAEVAGDLGVDMGTLEGAIGRMNKTAGASPEKFANLGVEIAKTRDGAVDVNGTFLNVIDTLRNTEDPAKKAALAQQLLGRSWQDLAEVVNDPNLRSNLAAVTEAQIIDREEVEKARQYRESMDNLGDSIAKVQMAVGEALVPVLSDLADQISGVVDAANMLPGGLGTLFDLANEVGPIAWARRLGDGYQFAADKLNDVFNPAVEGVVASTTELSGSLGPRLTDEWVRNFDQLNSSGTRLAREGLYVTAEEAANAREALADMADETDDTKGSVNRLKSELDLLKGSLDIQQASLSAADSLARLKEEGGFTAQNINSAQQSVLNLASALDGYLSDQQRRTIAVQVQSGQLDQALRTLENLRAGIDAVNRTPVVVKYSRTGTTGNLVPLADGGIVTGPTPALVGERGPEAIIPLDRLGSTPGGRSVTVNIDARGAVGLDENALARTVVTALKRAGRVGIS